jgi:hypothetical protein
VRYVLIIGLAVFRSIDHEHNVLNKGNSERKIILKRNELTESGGSEAGTRQKKRREAKLRNAAHGTSDRSRTCSKKK